jgi:hypothetical protein
MFMPAALPQVNVGVPQPSQEPWGRGRHLFWPPAGTFVLGLTRSERTTWLCRAGCCSGACPGVLFRCLSVVPYGRMQFVDITAGSVERLYKLATVRLHTAAAASDARIPGLEPEEAARRRDRLAALGEAKAAGL